MGWWRAPGFAVDAGVERSGFLPQWGRAQTWTAGGRPRHLGTVDIFWDSPGGVVTSYSLTAVTMDWSGFILFPKHPGTYMLENLQLPGARSDWDCFTSFRRLGGARSPTARRPESVDVFSLRVSFSSLAGSAFGARRRRAQLRLLCAPKGRFV